MLRRQSVLQTIHRERESERDPTFRCIVSQMQRFRIGGVGPDVEETVSGRASGPFCTR